MSGGPSAPGRRFPLKAGGAELRLLYGAWRDVGPRKELVPRPFTPHISPLVAFRKIGDHIIYTNKKHYKDQIPSLNEVEKVYREKYGLAESNEANT